MELDDTREQPALGFECLHNTKQATIIDLVLGLDFPFFFKLKKLSL